MIKLLIYASVIVDLKSKIKVFKRKEEGRKGNAYCHTRVYSIKHLHFYNCTVY